MHTYSCRWPYLAEVLALFDTPDLGDTDPCERSAVWATVVWAERDGQDVETTVRTCVPHDAKVQGLPGYQDSLRLPQP
jgi:hypothetical protein